MKTPKIGNLRGRPGLGLLETISGHREDIDMLVDMLDMLILVEIALSVQMNEKQMTPG